MNHSASPEQELVYHIDGRERLCEVGADWVQFALANDGAAVMPERVLGRSLCDFIEDANVSIPLQPGPMEIPPPTIE